MKSIIEVLEEYAIESNSIYNVYHHINHRINSKVLKDFLSATMDEVRFKYANDYAKLALDIIDMGELDYFRKGLLRREVGGEISYLKHREHSAHTLYNYLIGWFIYENNEIVKSLFDIHFKKRNKEYTHRDFAYLWPFVSIIHDIGYLFEGTIAPLATYLQTDQIKIGVEVVTDYFNHYLWNICGFNSVFERERLIKLSNVKLPEIRARSMGELAGSLRYLGDLEKIKEKLTKENQSNNCPIPEVIPGDSFSLWEYHYRSIGLGRMAERIKWLEKVFYHFLDVGLGSGGPRILDHGVCSGLLSLLNSTYYFNIYFNLYRLSNLNNYDNELKERFIKSEDNIDYDIDWWWSAIVWGTAATAIHNIQQLGDKDLGDFKKDKLDIQDDPLGYLGILVDCLQEWDRTTTFRETVMGGRLPLQGKDVDLAIVDGKITIDFNNKDYSDNVIKNLDLSLVDWDKIIFIKKSIK